MGLTRMIPWTWTPWFFRSAVNSFTPGQRTWKSNSWNPHQCMKSSGSNIIKKQRSCHRSRNSSVPPTEWAAESHVPGPEWTCLWTGLPGHLPASGRSHLWRRLKTEISKCLWWIQLYRRSHQSREGTSWFVHSHQPELESHNYWKVFVTGGFPLLYFDFTKMMYIYIKNVCILRLTLLNRPTW